MSRRHPTLLSSLALCAALLAAVPVRAADAPVARGLIVQLKPADGGGRESAQAERERLATVAADAGLSGEAPMRVGSQ